MEYLINVLMTVSPYFVFFLALYLIVPISIKSDKVRSEIKKLSIVGFTVVLVFSMISPSNTYKNKTNYNKQVDLLQIEKSRPTDGEVASLILVDKSRKSDKIEKLDENFKKLVDYKKGEEDNEQDK